MSERLADVREAEERFGRFVLTHVGLARRWEVMDRNPDQPMDFVMFSCEGDDSVSADLDGLAAMSHYGMEIFMKRTGLERKKDPRTIPSVYIDLQPGDLEILDPYMRFGGIASAYDPTKPFYDAAAVNELIDKLESLKRDKVFVAAGLRTFPGETVNY